MRNPEACSAWVTRTRIAPTSTSSPATTSRTKPKPRRLRRPPAPMGTITWALRSSRSREGRSRWSWWMCETSTTSTPSSVAGSTGFFRRRWTMRPRSTGSVTTRRPSSWIATQLCPSQVSLPGFVSGRVRRGVRPVSEEDDVTASLGGTRVSRRGAVRGAASAERRARPSPPVSGCGLPVQSLPPCCPRGCGHPLLPLLGAGQVLEAELLELAGAQLDLGQKVGRPDRPRVDRDARRVGGDEDDDGLRALASDHTRRLEPANAGHMDVEQDEIRLQLREEPDRLLAGRRDADEVQALCLRDERRADPLEDLAVVDHEHTSMHMRPCGRRAQSGDSCLVVRAQVPPVGSRSRASRAVSLRLAQPP